MIMAVRRRGSLCCFLAIGIYQKNSRLERICEKENEPTRAYVRHPLTPGASLEPTPLALPLSDEGQKIIESTKSLAHV